MARLWLSTVVRMYIYMYILYIRRPTTLLYTFGLNDKITYDRVIRVHRDQTYGEDPSARETPGVRK